MLFISPKTLVQLVKNLFLLTMAYYSQLPKMKKRPWNELLSQPFRPRLVKVLSFVFTKLFCCAMQELFIIIFILRKFCSEAREKQKNIVWSLLFIFCYTFNFGELKTTKMAFHWCALLGFGTQPHYEAPGGFRVELEIELWFTSDEWRCLLVNGPKLALAQSNSW